MRCRKPFWLLALAVIWNAAAGSARADGFPPPTYSAKEIRATVVDGPTGRPLEGVVLVAQWVLRRPGGDGPRLQVTEAVTDAQGHFFIPAWGPKGRPPLMELHAKSPQLLLFKHGYVPLRLRNQPKREFVKFYPNYQVMTTRKISELMTYEGSPDQAAQECFWDGMSIQLEPFRGTPDRWLKLLGSHSISIEDEDARYTRKFWGGLVAEEKYFEVNRVDPSNRMELDSLFFRVKRLLEQEMTR